MKRPWCQSRVLTGTNGRWRNTREAVGALTNKMQTGEAGDGEVSDLSVLRCEAGSTPDCAGGR